MQGNPRRALLVVASILATSLISPAADKQYQTGKFLDVTSEGYSKLVSNPSNGSSVSVRRHENDLSVQIGDIVYVGQCEESKHWSSCRPGNWIVGDPIEFRIDKENMYLKKPTGGEVKTKIVKRIRANSQ